MLMRRSDMAVLTVRLDQLRQDVRDLADAQAAHIDQHNQDKRLAMAARHWYVGTLLTVIGLVIAMLAVLLPRGIG